MADKQPNSFVASDTTDASGFETMTVQPNAVDNASIDPATGMEVVTAVGSNTNWWVFGGLAALVAYVMFTDDDPEP